MRLYSIPIPIHYDFDCASLVAHSKWHYFSASHRGRVSSWVSGCSPTCWTRAGVSTMVASGALIVEQFGRRYSRRAPWAVRGLTAELAAGTVTALVGPNGAGKSTLVRACVGFEPPDEGRIVVVGHDVVRERRDAVAAVGYVPQSTSLYRNLTIADHFAIAQAARRNFDRPYAASLIDNAGLSERRLALSRTQAEHRRRLASPFYSLLAVLATGRI